MIFHKIKKERPKPYISPRPYDKNWKEQYNIKVKNHSNGLIDNDLLIVFCSYIKNKYKKSKKIFINYYNHNDITVEDDKTKKSYSNSNINYGNYQVLKTRHGSSIIGNFPLTQSQLFNSYKLAINSVYGQFGSGKSLYFNSLSNKKCYNFDNMFIIDDVLYICETDEDRLLINRKIKISKIKNAIIQNKEKIR